ncbi:MAG: LysR family transcriptional regulator [Alphaproteobacteria bacterium]|nr:LysR family transcriptional regulator [Alphaproteobacteria bacterium]
MATIKAKTAFLRELLALKEVIDIGQIHAAAERNGIKHSNFSKMITDLETKFKTRLLIRSSSGSVPTNTTRQLYADIESISNALDNIITNLTGPEELTGYISIWTEEGFAGSLLFSELTKLYAKHPKIRLDILTNRHMNMSNPDITIMDIRSLNKIPGTKPLFKFKTKVKFYASPDYLQKRGVPRDIEDMLENYDLCMRQKFLELPECNFVLKRAKKLNTTADSASIIYQLVCDGAGIALMPEWCTMKNAKLVEVPNIDFDYEYVLSGISNPLTAKSPKVQAFLEFFYEFCQQYDIPLEMFE